MQADKAFANYIGSFLEVPQNRTGFTHKFHQEYVIYMSKTMVE